MGNKFHTKHIGLAQKICGVTYLKCAKVTK